MFLDFGRDICGQIEVAGKREWLVTNGIGGYASGTVAGVLTRRYHGLLVAALRPPLGRTLLLAKLDETAEYDGIRAESGHYYPLFVNRWSDGEALTEPLGHHHINRFHLEGTTPVWTFGLANALLEKRIWMQPGANTTYIQYRLARATGPLLLQAKAMANYRDYHRTTIMNDWQAEIVPVERGLRLQMVADGSPYYVFSDKAALSPHYEWYEDYFLSEEDYRGQNDVEDDHLYMAHLRHVLQPGETVTVVTSTESVVNLNGDEALAERVAYERDKLARARMVFAGPQPPAVEQLVLAADQFVVNRPTRVDRGGRTIIAGYPWFGDWGRDTMIALPGLTLATGQPEIAATILRTFAQFVDQGMIPNRFADEGETPEYNTVDATLWYVEAIRAYFAATGDISLMAELFPVLAGIVAWHQRGTRYNIHVDERDGLLYAGEEGVQLTWMDAKVQEWVVTPRTGKAVEINALWHNALKAIAEIARELGEDAQKFEDLAERAAHGFERFWNPEAGYCFDVLDTPQGNNDAALRPNQLLAVSLPYSPLSKEQMAAVVDACSRHLLIAYGLRSLAPQDDAYIGHYGGDQLQRDGAYHQGTAWSWLIGTFVEAHLRVHGDPRVARSFLLPLLQHMEAHGVGNISEIFDGDPPFTPRGCIAQAWGVAELLRAWQLTEEAAHGTLQTRAASTGAWKTGKERAADEVSGTEPAERQGRQHMSNIRELNGLGQSIWYDNIDRDLIESGELGALIEAGISGITSNPSIFQKAITSSKSYAEDLRELARQDGDAQAIFEALAIDDIRRAADLLYPIYEETNGRDGYVSLEVNPGLAHDTAGTVEEARRLFTALGRPNAMIKVPATQAGIPAIATLIGEGININVTLLFANDNYQQVAEAYIEGLEAYVREGGDPSHVASVASFFVSRVDTIVDKALEAIGNEELQGKIAIANAKIAYTMFEELFSGPRWEALAEEGARPQRLLWASTSTKNANYSDTMYMDGLIGPETVNTAPPDTIQAFEDHGRVALTLTVDVDEARQQLAQLEAAGIDLDQLTDRLQRDGVEAFATAFNGLLESIRAERRRVLATNMELRVAAPGYQEVIEDGLSTIAAERIIERIWSEDHTVWKPDPAEISNRLGWLTIAEEMQGNLDRLDTFVDSVRAEGYTDVALLGMGGSSLAPEVFSELFGTADGYLKLHVIDSTDPGFILEQEARLDLSKTLFIVATKSGGTAETLSFFKYFYNQVAEAVGAEEAGRHFVAVTDPGSKLVTLAETYHFRDIFLNNPHIGGRYSALSYFGLLAAALIGVDLRVLLQQARIAACNAGGEECPPTPVNVAAVVGVAMGELAERGRDKLTLILSPRLAGFGNWVEQLVAESTGKEGKGILPVVGEAVAAPESYGDDRLFVYLRQDGDDTLDEQVAALEEAGQPVIYLSLDDLRELGRQFFLWEMATAVAGNRLGIQPFNQPNVEEAKVQARQMIAAYQEEGSLPEVETVQPSAGSLGAFLDDAQPGDYVAIHAYLKPEPDTDMALDLLRRKLRDVTGLAVTVGYGPRFLHSTGQLHKGDAGNGWFVQLTADMPQDAAIPDKAGEAESSITFGVLKTAQAMGDAAALRDAGRRVITFDLGADARAGIAKLGT